MDKIFSGKNSALIVFILIFALWAVIFLPGLGTHELKGEEGRRVMPALDMIKTGQYLVPYIGGEPYLNKPPTINWIIIASVKLFHSSSEFVVRLPSPLSLLALCIVILFLPCRQFNLELRFLACITTLSCLGLITKGRLIEIETIYVAQTAIACIWWLFKKIDNASRWQQYLVPMLFLAFAMLTKGPLAILIFYILVITVTAKTKSWKDFFCFQHLLCLALIFIPVYLWYHAIDTAGFAELRDARMKGEVGKRFSKFKFQPERIFQEGLPAILNLMPWLLFMPICWMKHFIDNIPSQQRPYYLALRFAFVISMAVIILMPRTLTRYSLPILPLGLFLFSWCLYHNKTIDHNDNNWKNGLSIFAFILALASLSGLIYDGLSSYALILIVICSTAVYLIFIKKFLQSSRTELSILTSIIVALAMNLYIAFSPLFETEETSSRTAAAHIQSVIPEDTTLHICYPDYQIFIYYLDTDYQYIAPENISDSNAEYILIKKRDLEQLPQLHSWNILEIFNYREDRDFAIMQRRK